jgi:uncharacterized protein (TIGR03382 family)
MSRIALVVAGSFSHGASMRVWGWGRVLLAALLLFCVGCDSSAELGAGSGGFHGGQTGSLVPCSTPPQFTSEPGVPGGDAAFVFHTGCGADTDFSLTDAEGKPVTFQVETLDDGVVLLRTETALEPGAYTVVAPDGSQRSVTVTEPSPLPSRLGTLRHVGGCYPMIELALAAELLPYLPLLRLEYSLDGHTPPSTWFEYGTVMPYDGVVRLELDALPAGGHQLTVTGSLAGEAAAPDPATLQFFYECFENGSASGSGCSIEASRASAGFGPTGWLPLALLALVALRRKRWF